MSQQKPIEVRAALWPRDAPVLAHIRREVFVLEQAVPEELEWDGEDDTARHWLALIDGVPAGTVRMLADGHIGRMAVLAAHRQLGIGSRLLTAAIADARQRALIEVYLHAQVHALRFYSAHGFVAEGAEFVDAGIPHRAMRLRC